MIKAGMPTRTVGVLSFSCFQSCDDLIRGEIIFRHVLLQIFHILLFLLFDEFLTLVF